MELKNFEDIYTAICNELKVPLTDTETVDRIKRDINMVYLQEVIPFKQRKWDWLVGFHSFATPTLYRTGSVQMTKGSDIITFSDLPGEDITGHLLKVDGFPEMLKIKSHDFGDTELIMLEFPWPFDTVDNGFKLWQDTTTLPSTFNEIISVTHNRRDSAMDILHNAAFDRMVSKFPDLQRPPQACTLNARTFKWFPACNDVPYIINIEGRLKVSALELDGDLPVVPEEDRIVIFYGACSRAWSRERNEGEANRNWGLFMRKLGQMAARSSSGSDTVEMQVDDRYLINKRYKRYSRRGSNNRGFRID